MAAEVVSDKKTKLLLYKENLLKEIQDCEARINELLNSRTHVTNFQDDSSESDDGYLDNCKLLMGPQMSQLKVEQEHLMIRLHATEELTGLKIVQSEVNVLADSPDIDNDDSPKEDGTWKEVTAECRAENLRFTVSFYCHQPARKFAPLTYHNLQVEPIKEFHAKELENSVLKGLDKPSDAVQVIRSYATACRSRRETLTQILENFGDHLSMNKLPKGGYSLSCPGVLELTWVLQNKWSPIAPFHHSMYFEVENVEEIHLKKIKVAHRQIRDPTIDTEERTVLLSKIIEVCIEAKMANGDIKVDGSENGLESNQREQVYKNGRNYMIQGNADRVKSIQTSKMRESEKENIPTTSTGKRHNSDEQGDIVQKKSKTIKITKASKGASEQEIVKTKNNGNNKQQNKNIPGSTGTACNEEKLDKENQNIENVDSEVVPPKLINKLNKNVGSKKNKTANKVLAVQEKQEMASMKDKEKEVLLDKNGDNQEMLNKGVNDNDQVVKQNQDLIKQGKKDNLVINKKVKPINKETVYSKLTDKKPPLKVSKHVEKKKKVELQMEKTEGNKEIIKESNGAEKVEKNSVIKGKDGETQNKTSSIKGGTNNKTFVINGNHGQKNLSNNVKSNEKEILSIDKIGDGKENKVKNLNNKNKPQHKGNVIKEKQTQNIKDQKINNNLKKDLAKQKGIQSHEFKKPKPFVGRNIAVDKKKTVERENLITNRRDKFFLNSNKAISKIPKSAKLPEINHNAIGTNTGITSMEKKSHNISKIPLRKVSSFEKFKVPQRASPRFMKKSAVKPKTIFGATKK